MRKSSNPFRGIGPRSGLALVLLALLIGAALAAGAATADRPKHERPAKAQKPVPSSTAIASARAITNRVKAIAKADTKLRKKAQVAAKKKRGLASFDLPILAVADGNALYSATVRIRAKKDYEDLVSLRLVIERTDRTTGTKVTLLDKRNTYPLGLYAEGGSVGLETISLTTDGKDVGAKTAIYTATHAEAALRAIDVTELTLDGDEDVCGRFSILTGLSDLAEPMIAAIDAECKKDNSDIEELTAELELWKADGTRKPLGPAAIESAIFGNAFVLKGSKLLQPNPYEPATALRDLSSDKLQNVWTPAATKSDLAADGSVALIGTPAESASPYYSVSDGEYSGEYFRKTGSSADADPPTNKPAVRKFPLVVFPGGDPENPVLVNASRQGIAAMKFCGPNLYVLDRISTKGSRGGIDAEFEDFFFFQWFYPLKLDVQLYDTQGHLLRSLVKTHPLSLAGVGCNGDKLILISLRQDKFVTTEIGT